MKQKPGTIEAFLRIRAKARRKVISAKPPFSCHEAFILAYGRTFQPKPYPRRLNAYRGEGHACFKNAWWLVLVSDGQLRYVEGFAAPGDSVVKWGKAVFPNAIHHAWAIDENDRVIEPTWRAKGGRYFGVVFDFGYLMRTSVRKREHTSLIDNLRDEFPLLTGKHTEADWMPKEK